MSSSSSQGRTDRWCDVGPVAHAGRLASAFLALFRRHAPDPLAIARQARWEAAEHYADAKRAGDTRAVHHSHAAFRRATAEVVRLEIAARGGA